LARFETQQDIQKQGKSSWVWALGRGIVGCFVALLILITLLWNLANLDNGKRSWILPDSLDALGRLMAMDQHFQMFGKPPVEGPWFVYRAELNDGREVDIFRGGVPVDLKKPAQIRLTFPDINWRKLHRNLMAERLKGYRQPLLDYAVRHWNETHPETEQVRFAEMVMHCEMIGPEYDGVNLRTAIWSTWHAKGNDAGWRFEQLQRQLDRGERPIF
jgi:hypothetical protein